jgi:CRISPR-associated protein Cmr2
MTTKQHLIAIAIGPIQEFIASARKLSDLWYGSYLLSELSKAVARSLHEQGCSLIFPVMGSSEDLHPGSNLNVANKILAISTDKDPSFIISQARQDFQTHWQKICNRVQQQLPRGAADEKTFHAQSKDFGEFFGVWVELNPEYQKSRLRAEQFLIGRKALREFGPPTWLGNGIPKSSLDGVRESILINNDSLQKRFPFALKKGEHLDLLGMVKRLGPFLESSSTRPHFEHLAEIAVLPFIAGIKSHIGAQEILEKLPSLPPPGVEVQGKTPRILTCLPTWFRIEWLLPSCLDEWLAERALTNDHEWKKVCNLLKMLYETVKCKPSPYACLVVGDGDHMGGTLEQLNKIETHQAFSSELSQFARSMDDVAEYFDGRLIYSGGDDVMAYVPLHKAISYVTAIQSTFKSAMERSSKETGIKTPTLSIGMAVVHQRYPLHKALDLARKAEKTAKNEGGRNALSILRSRRGGKETIIHGKWSRENNTDPIHDRQRFMIDLYKNKILSSRLAYQLRETAVRNGNRMEWHIGAGQVFPGNVTAAEAMRLAARKRGADGCALDPLLAAKLLANYSNLRSLADELVVASQFAEAESMADGFRLQEKSREEEE